MWWQVEYSRLGRVSPDACLFLVLHRKHFDFFRMFSCTYFFLVASFKGFFGPSKRCVYFTLPSLLWFLIMLTLGDLKPLWFPYFFLHVLNLLRTTEVVPSKSKKKSYRKKPQLTGAMSNIGNNAIGWFKANNMGNSSKKCLSTYSDIFLHKDMIPVESVNNTKVRDATWARQLPRNLAAFFFPLGFTRRLKLRLQGSRLVWTNQMIQLPESCMEMEMQ